MVVRLTSLIFLQAMPVIVLDLKIPASLEEGLDSVRVQARRFKRRLRINWSRKWSVFRYGLRTVIENFKKDDDKKPILKRERGKSSLYFASHVIFVVRRICRLRRC